MAKQKRSRNRKGSGADGHKMQISQAIVTMLHAVDGVRVERRPELKIANRFGQLIYEVMLTLAPDTGGRTTRVSSDAR